MWGDVGNFVKNVGRCGENCEECGKGRRVPEHGEILEK